MRLCLSCSTQILRVFLHDSLPRTRTAVYHRPRRLLTIPPATTQRRFQSVAAAERYSDDDYIPFLQSGPQPVSDNEALVTQILARSPPRAPPVEPEIEVAEDVRWGEERQREFMEECESTEVEAGMAEVVHDAEGAVIVPQRETLERVEKEDVDGGDIAVSPRDMEAEAPRSKKESRKLRKLRRQAEKKGKWKPVVQETSESKDGPNADLEVDSVQKEKQRMTKSQILAELAKQRPTEAWTTIDGPQSEVGTIAQALNTPTPEPEEPDILEASGLPVVGTLAGEPDLPTAEPAPKSARKTDSKPRPRNREFAAASRDRKRKPSPKHPSSTPSTPRTTPRHANRWSLPMPPSSPDATPASAPPVPTALLEKLSSIPPNRRPAWLVEKAALALKTHSAPWRPQKRLSPEAQTGIRALHAQYPETYSTPKLAQLFEVTPVAIRKILKSKWRPSEEEERRRGERWDRRGREIWGRWVEEGVVITKAQRKRGRMERAKKEEFRAEKDVLRERFRSAWERGDEGLNRGEEEKERIF